MNRNSGRRRVVAHGGLAGHTFSTNPQPLEKVSNMNTEQRKNPASKLATATKEGTAGVICDYPMSSVLVVCGIGICAGIALGSLVLGPPAPPTLGRRTELAAEQLGRQMLGAIAGVLPASLAKHIAV